MFFGIETFLLPRQRFARSWEAAEALHGSSMSFDLIRVHLNIRLHFFVMLRGSLELLSAGFSSVKAIPDMIKLLKD